MYIISLVFFTAFVAFVRCDLNLIVKTHTGAIRGIRHVESDRIFKIFYNVPYAEPPVNELRFQPPVPVKPWFGVRDGTKPPPICVQPQIFSNYDTPMVGQEDCLYLNIYVPNILVKGMKKSPVIVVIHGGGFQVGSANAAPSDYFMDKNVITVAMNYRLGVLGFLGMNNDVISGNYGMKDQVLALKWTKENIAAFGGDPDSITLMGGSAGSASVHAHMFSPLSKGLFHKAIMRSGQMFAPWTYYNEADREALNKKFFSAIGCSETDHVQVLKCLQRKPAKDLIQSEGKLYTWGIDPVFLFKFTIESNVKNRPFLPAEPTRDTYVSKNIPWIMGMTSGESIFKVIGYLANDGALVKMINSDRNRLIPLINQYVYTTEPQFLDDITRRVCDFYFGANEIGPSTISGLVRMLSDFLMTFGLIQTAMTNNGIQYVYYYDHQGSDSTARNAGLSLDLGVCHDDDTRLIFRNEENEKKWTPEDKRVSAEILKFWVNFATYSDPNGHFAEKLWKPVKTSGIEYLHIRSNSSVMENNFLKERRDFLYSLPIGKKFV